MTEKAIMVINLGACPVALTEDQNGTVKGSAVLSPTDRAVEAVHDACRWLSETRASVFRKLFASAEGPQKCGFSRGDRLAESNYKTCIHWLDKPNSKLYRMRCTSCRSRRNPLLDFSMC